jgi:hypothetical protein
MSADTLTPESGPIILTAPTIQGYGSFVSAGFAAMGGSPDELTVAWRSSSGLVATTYNLDGSVVNTLELENNVAFMDPPNLATVQGGVAIGWNNSSGAGNAVTRNDYLTIIHSDGANDQTRVLNVGTTDQSGWPEVSSDLNGVHISWIEERPDGEQPHEMQDFTPYMTAVGAATPISPTPIRRWMATPSRSWTTRPSCSTARRR